MDIIELGRKIAEFAVTRKISFDGECYHPRVPLELIEILKKDGASIVKVRWEGVWRNNETWHVVLTFLPDEESKESETEPADEKEESDDDYAVLKG